MRRGWRSRSGQEFHCDVMTISWCYRKNGHNEQDEAGYTQPVWRAKSTAKVICPRFVRAAPYRAGYCSARRIEEKRARNASGLDARCHARANPGPSPARGVRRGVESFSRPARIGRRSQGSADFVLRQESARATRLPEDSPSIASWSVARRLEDGAGVGADRLGGAEMLALGSLVLEGTLCGHRPTRKRGTFSHRHAALRDYNTGDK